MPLQLILDRLFCPFQRPGPACPFEATFPVGTELYEPRYARPNLSQARFLRKESVGGHVPPVGSMYPSRVMYGADSSQVQPILEDTFIFVYKSILSDIRL